MINVFQNILVLTADRANHQIDESSGVQPDITLRRILLGQAVSLEQYRSLASKTSMLDAAIASGNGNAILGVSNLFNFLNNFTMKK